MSDAHPHEDVEYVELTGEIALDLQRFCADAGLPEDNDAIYLTVGGVPAVSLGWLHFLDRECRTNEAAGPSVGWGEGVCCMVFWVGAILAPDLCRKHGFKAGQVLAWAHWGHCSAGHITYETVYYPLRELFARFGNGPGPMDAPLGYAADA